jgi:hypothetical protein
VATGLAGSSPTPPSSSRSSGNSPVPPSQTLSLGEASLQFLAVYFGGEGEQSLSVFLPNWFSRVVTWKRCLLFLAILVSPRKKCLIWFSFMVTGVEYLFGPLGGRRFYLSVG